MIDYFIAKVRKFTMIMIIVSLLALIFMPLLPWVSMSAGDTTNWMGEGEIDIGAETADSATQKSDFQKAQIGMRGNLGLIGLSFWMTILFGIIIMMGIGIYNMGQKYRLFSHIIFLIGIMFLIFAILIVISHVWFLGNVGTLSDEAGKNVDYAFSFNYLPLIMGVILLIISIMYTIQIFPASLRAITSHSRQSQMRYYQQGPQQPGFQQGPPQQMQQTSPPQPTQQPPQPQTQQKPPQPQGQKQGAAKFCPTCGTKISGNPKFCPKCGKKLI